MTHQLGEIQNSHDGFLPSTLRCRILTFFAGGALVFMFVSRVWAIPSVDQLADVPVERIVANLERHAISDPKDFQSRFNLARAHVLAYAMKSDMVQVRKGGKSEDVWFGPMAKSLPPYVAPTRDATRLKEATAHLSKALKRYEEALELYPEHLAARLGHAWAVEQSGDKVKAIASYRALIKDAWKQEKELKEPAPGWVPVTPETSIYLMALLDPSHDKDEIDVLQSRITSLPAFFWHGPRSPVVVPLRDGLGVEDLMDREARVAFDADGTGVKKSWDWVTRDAGWLIFDPRDSRSIKSTTQMFGAASFGMSWDNGYQALDALDDNGDGELTGKELEGLAIWQDLNGNGVCDFDEMKPVAAWNIVAISCRAEKGAIPSGCAAFAQTGVILRGGHTRPTYDVLLYPARGLRGQLIQKSFSR
jgi:hypothetical protein